MEEKQKKLGPYKRAVLEAQAKAGDTRLEEDGLVLHQYPDYDTYCDVQVAGNKAKLRMQFVKESHIKILSGYISEKVGTVDFGICHGTRRGAEQTWFRDHLEGAPDVIGTEISDTADQFPHTVQWDFHDVNPEWTGKADFVYSNSWDHAYKPKEAFDAWFDALKPGGLLLLDYTKGQTPESANALDPFGITYDRLLEMLAENFDRKATLLEGLNTRKINKEYRARVIALQKNA